MLSLSIYLTKTKFIPTKGVLNAAGKTNSRISIKQKYRISKLEHRDNRVDSTQDHATSTHSKQNTLTWGPFQVGGLTNSESNPDV